MSVTVVRGGTLPPVNYKEVLRYAGVRAADSATEALLPVCEKLIAPHVSPRACYREMAVTRTDGELFIGSAATSSLALERSLQGCDRVVLFGATLGLDVDRLIVRESAASPATALLLDALAVERIEAFCDTLCAELSAHYAAEGRFLCPRYSPGYGDLPLFFQETIFSLLDLPKTIGLTLNKSLMMSPQKSVTALLGIRKRP